MLGFKLILGPSVRLFKLLGAETHIFIKAEGIYVFGLAQNATF